MTTRCLTILLGCAALALAACGSDDGGGPTATPAAARARPPVTIKHALGTTRVPGEPQRIVVTNPYSLFDYLLALGVKPIGSTGDQAADYPFASWLKGRTHGVEVVGDVEELDLERIAALHPDLILADPWREEDYPRLARIAPTVAVPLDYTDYEKELRFVARVVGREARAQQVIDAHHEKLAALKRDLGASAPVVSVARLFPDSGQIEGRSYVPTLIHAAGLKRPAAHEKDPDGLKFSLERLSVIDADQLFVYSTANAAEDEANAKARKALERNPL